MATKRRNPAWLKVACPTCGAGPGERCNWIGDPCSLPCGEAPGVVERPHTARRRLATDSATCKETTKAGKRCTRRVAVGFRDGQGVRRRLCWQHGRDAAEMLRAMVP